MKTRLGILFFLFLSSIPLRSQNSEWGVELAVGGATYTHWLDGPLPSLFSQFFNDDLDLYFFSIGGNYYHPLSQEWLYFSAGINYTYRRTWEYDRLNYLNIPLGLELRLGKKTQFIFGGTLQPAFLVKETLIPNDVVSIFVKRKMILGLGGKVGILIPLNKLHALEIGYRSIRDLQESFGYSSLTGTYVEKYILADSSIYLSFRMKFPEKRKDIR